MHIYAPFLPVWFQVHEIGAHAEILLRFDMIIPLT